MQRYNLSLPFSFGSTEVQVSLSGRYSELDQEADDRLRSAIVASQLQLPQWRLDSPFSDGSSSSQDQRGEATVKIENGHGIIEVMLSYEDSQGKIRQETCQMIADAIASSVQNHADSAILHVPATNDVLVQIQRHLTARAFDPSQRELIGAGSSQN